MVLRISQKIVSTWCRYGIISYDDKDAYVYGVQLLISTWINVQIIAVVSFLLHIPFAWIGFLLGFVPLRITAGGFHAKSPLMCSVSFCGAYTLSMGASQLLQGDIIIITIIINCLVTSLSVYFFSPIPACNKPLDENEKKKNRKCSIVLLCMLLLAIICLIMLFDAKRNALQLSLGGMVMAIFLCIGRVLSFRV